MIPMAAAMYYLSLALGGPLEPTRAIQRYNFETMPTNDRLGLLSLWGMNDGGLPPHLIGTLYGVSYSVVSGPTQPPQEIKAVLR